MKREKKYPMAVVQGLVSTSMVACVNSEQCDSECKCVSRLCVTSKCMVLKILLSLSQNGSNKQFWATELHG